jgi:hypothetical protein
MASLGDPDPRPVDQLPRRARLALILERDGPHCVWCRRPIDVGLVEATTEHLVPRVKGGPSWIENEVAACRRCNGQRGHLTPAEWIDECERRGWRPDRDAVVAALHRLQSAFARRGGQRRARPYVASQLRRLDPASRPGTRRRESPPEGAT